MLMQADAKTPWYKDAAFWVVAISFAVFLATAASIVWNLEATYPEKRHARIVESDERAQAVVVPSKTAARYTIDARNFRKWVYFDLSSGKIVHPLYVSSKNWDVAFRRYHIIANGGAANIAADGGILDAGNAPFDDVSDIPKSGYVLDTPVQGGAPGEVENAAIRHWYLYDYSTHVLTPMSHVYIVRTPAGKYFKFAILNYYCRDLDSGCVTFESAPLGESGVRGGWLRFLHRL